MHCFVLFHQLAEYFGAVAYFFVIIKFLGVNFSSFVVVRMCFYIITLLIVQIA